ncbi:hypothetical protein STEG23_020671, partial [Scotinomys teguina]
MENWRRTLEEKNVERNGKVEALWEFPDCGTVIAHLFHHSEKEQQIRQNEMEKCLFVQFLPTYPFFQIHFLSVSHYKKKDKSSLMGGQLSLVYSGSCFSLSLSIPILDCHHTWCCCGTPSDFYCATQT